MFPELSEVKKRRMRLSLTQKKLAQIADVSQSLIAKIESGNLNPGYSIVRRIFEALESLEHAENRTAKDIMNKHVISVSPNELLKGILKTMKEKNIEQMPVIEKGAQVGSVSEDSIVHFLSTYNERKSISELTVKDVMADAFPTTKEDANYRLLLELLNYNRAILIMKQGKIIGIVTKADLLRIK